MTSITVLNPSLVNSQNNLQQTLVVIDSAVNDYQLLLEGIEPDAQVIVLDSRQDGIAQISQILAQQPVTSLQIIAHGSPGSLQLGNIQLNVNNLHYYQPQLQLWQITELLIYSCELAQGETGQAFISQLHQMTGANIAASTNKVGSSQQRGSWELGVKMGEISSHLKINPTIKNNYPHVLADVGLVWAKNLGGSGFDQGNSIAVDSAGNIYTTGYFNGTVDFDPGAGIFNLTSAGNEDIDIFISKLNSDGSFAWATNIGGSSNDVGNSIKVDSAGNIYTTGYFNGTADFDPGDSTFNLTTPAGVPSIFISKLNSNGSFVWAKSIERSGSQSIAVDSAGNIYTTGYFNGTADFDPGDSTFNLTSAGIFDIFISKLNSNGSFVWAKNFRGNGNNRGNSIAVDSVGNIYTTGSFRGTADFDPGAGTFNLTSAGYNNEVDDIFISKLNSDGSFVWAKQLGWFGYDQGKSITVDSAGNIYTTGYFHGTVDFDPSDSTFNLTSAGSNTNDNDIFISKLNSDGSFVWAKNLGGSGYDQGNSITVDSVGNIYITGLFQGTADFDPGDSTFNLTSAGISNAFISKLNSDGSFAWAKNLGENGQSIAVDSAGNIYTTGLFNGTADFDPGAGTFNLTSAGSRDIFIVKLGIVLSPGVTITPSSGSTDVIEGGATDTYTVVLDSQPTSNVTINLNAGSQLTTNTNSLTFTAANWNIAQTVTVTAVDDALVEGHYTDTIQHTATSSDTNYNGITIAPITVNITDNDIADVIIIQSGGSTNIAEGGATDTYSVVLNSQPTSNVTISINSGTQSTTNPTSLNFTAANWNVAQTVTVTAIDDVIIDGIHIDTIQHTVISTDSNYNGLTIAPITVNIIDNDSAISGAAPGNDILRGTPGNDTIDGLNGNDYLFGNAGDDILYGNNGTDYLSGNAGDDTLYGNDGSDFLYGNDGNDHLYGGEGGDNLDGGAGNDILEGGTGNDIYTVDILGDQVIELADAGIDKINSTITWDLTNSSNVENLTLLGNSTINGTGNNLNNHIVGNDAINTLNGGEGDDWLMGKAGNDTLIGGNGNDRLDGGSGNDQLIGGAGNDQYEVDSVDDIITEVADEGTDTIFSIVELPSLVDNVENLTLVGTGNINATGNNLNNRLSGNAGNNTLMGNGGDDFLSGGTGNDILIGGAGFDTLVGDAGLDIFDLTGSLSAFDTIRDFQAGETVLLSATEFGLSQVGILDAGLFYLGTAAQDESDRFIYNQTKGELFFDADGSGINAQVRIALFSNRASLSSTDFTVIFQAEG